MSSPFPGMDPYLEHPALWPGVHHGLIAALQLALAPQLRPRYYVALEERVYVTAADQRDYIGRPDVAIVGPSSADAEPVSAAAEPSVLSVRVPLPEVVRETYLEVRETGSEAVLTVLEILSPANKRPGRGRRMYEEKRMDVLATRTHLVEVDVVRVGEPMPIVDHDHVSDYRILVSRGDCRPHATLYIFGVRQTIPTFPLPLKSDDPEIRVDLGQVLHDLYDHASYDLRLDYSRDPEPPLSPEDTVWADRLLRQKGRRA